MSRIRTILLDPPWMERGGGKIKRGADRHYPLMSWQDIIKTIYRCEWWDWLNDDCHMWMWATANHESDALKVIDALGFRVITTVPWVKIQVYPADHPDVKKGIVLAGQVKLDEVGQVKTRTGLGQYIRHDHEFLKFCRRGKTMKPAKAYHSSSITAPRGKHSAKPEQSYQMIEHVSPGPRLELFARGEPRPGWHAWGNEVIHG